MEALFKQWAGEDCLKKTKISANGSNRIYYRLEGTEKKCIASINYDIKENEAFFYFANELRKRGINVPEIYAISQDRTLYLQQDLGNVTLLEYLISRKASGTDITSAMRDLYREALRQLLLIQNKCRDVDFSYAYPSSAFDRQAILWDLNYFKYYFLKLFHIPFDEKLLEKDFQTLVDYLLDDDCDFFMYRDFQSRNIMVHEDKLFFIDFQGARKGALYYDVASLLYSSKSDVPDALRKELLDFYIDEIQTTMPEYKMKDRQSFYNRYYAYVLTRIMQAMGAYGYRGVIEKKELFVKSIPYAVNNMRNIIENLHLPIDIPHLYSVWNSIAQMPEYNPDKEKLTVSIFSFSYRKGVPFDKTGNGGGYVFDCRALPNPGLYEEYKTLTGRDAEVVDFFLKHEETEQYLQTVRNILAFSINSYIERGYTRLMVNFGCTGGRHRSVYCAEQIAKFISQNFDCNVSLHHLEQSKL